MKENLNPVSAVLAAAQSGGATVVAGALTEPVTVPAGNILLARVDQLKMSME